MKKILALCILLSLLLSVAVPVMAQDNTITEIVEDLADADDDAEFTILLELLEEADLDGTLDDEDFEFTVFAPTDEAFADLLETADLELDDLLDNIDFVSEVLLYHVVSGVIESGDLEDEQEIETEQGGTLIISIDEETVMINGVAQIIEADIEASNGIIHVIDAVLVPEITGGEACLVSTDEENGASVHVGPGNNRTSITFLEPGVEYEVLGRNEDSEGVVWYQLDKEEAAPGRAINEAWVSSAEVDSTGDCENVGEVIAPPIIPVTNRPPVSTGNEGGGDDGGNEEDSPPPSGGVLPSAGTWTFFWNATTNASCTGTGNVAIPTIQVLGETSTTFVVSNVSSSGFNIGNVRVTSIGNGVYNGSITLFGITGTIYIDSVTASREMNGRFITSFDNCSATITFVAR